MGYLCANFGLPLCSRVIPDVRDKQTSDRRQTKAALNASALTGRGIISRPERLRDVSCTLQVDITFTFYLRSSYMSDPPIFASFLLTSDHDRYTLALF